MIAFLGLLLAALPPGDEEIKPGPYRITVRGAWFYSKASGLSATLREAKYAEHVTVMGIVKNGKQRWAQCDLGGGQTGYIASSAILKKEAFKAQAEGSEEEGAAKAESYHGSRFNPQCEEEFSKQKNLGPAYAQIDEWCGRPAAKAQGAAAERSALSGRPGWKNNRAAMLQELSRFRQEGRLGEFAGGSQ